MSSNFFYDTWSNVGVFGTLYVINCDYMNAIVITYCDKYSSTYPYMKAKLSERYKGAVFANASSLLLWRAYLSHLCSEVALFKINHVAAEYSRAFDIFNRIKVRPDVV